MYIIKFIKNMKIIDLNFMMFTPTSEKFAFSVAIQNFMYINKTI